MLLYVFSIVTYIYVVQIEFEEDPKLTLYYLYPPYDAERKSISAFFTNTARKNSPAAAGAGGPA